MCVCSRKVFLLLHHRGLPPGKLEDLRSASVNNNRFSAIAVVHRFYCYIWHASQVCCPRREICLLGLSGGCISVS
jgi:hypothetical protein